jgi:hypothetical protein
VVGGRRPEPLQQPCWSASATDSTGIGCGWLFCQMFNLDDRAGQRGLGPRYLLDRTAPIEPEVD